MSDERAAVSPCATHGTDCTACKRDRADAAYWRTSEVVAGGAAGAAQRVMLGADLDAAAKNFISSPGAASGAPLLAETIRRFTKLTFFQIALALVPQGLLIAQTLLLNRQTTILQEQTAFLREQAQFTAQQTTSLQEQQLELESQRRSAYATTIYGSRPDGCPRAYARCPLDARECVDEQKLCPPSAELRLRQEAACSYIRLQNTTKQRVLLDHAQVPWLDLGSCGSLESAELGAADLRCANLAGVSLKGADLSHADLRGAFGTPTDPPKDPDHWKQTICPDGKRTTTGCTFPAEWDETREHMCNALLPPPAVPFLD